MLNIYLPLLSLLPIALPSFIHNQPIAVSPDILKVVFQVNLTNR